MKLNDTPTGIRPEDDLLLCCSRVNMEPEKAERIKVLLRNEINWQYLIQMALRHGLIPLLYKNLKATNPDAIPEGIFDQLRKYFLINASRNLILTEELHKLLNLFEANSIIAIPYKGPALAASIYGDITLRQFSDLDILIQKQDVLRARDLIVSQGYRPHFRLTDVSAEPYLKSQNELSFTRHDGKVIVELQWEIAPRYFSFPIPSQYLWERLKSFSRKDLEFWTLPPEIELIIICVHGAKDQWTRLLWICDVAELIRKNDGLDWDWVIRLSSTLGSLRMLFLGLFLANDLLNASIPGEVMQQVEGDPRVRRLARQVRQRLFRGPNGSSGIFKNPLFHLKARERMRDRIQYCVRLAMTTTPGDWTFLPLPHPLFPLYYLIRPIRLMAKYGLKPLEKIHNR
jgi:hypothetical protein